MPLWLRKFLMGRDVPSGDYCYEPGPIVMRDTSQGRLPVMQMKLCPHWRSPSKARPDGFCDLLKCGGMLIFDQVKECGINMGEPVEDEITPWIEAIYRDGKDQEVQ